MNKPLFDEILEHLKPYPDARQFLEALERLCHAVVAIIRRDNPNVSDYRTLTLDAFGLALHVYSSKFYHDNFSWLSPLIKDKHRVFSASSQWEKHTDSREADHAELLRCGRDGTLLIAVLEHVCHLPDSELRRIGGLIRQDSLIRHHDDGITRSVTVDPKEPTKPRAEVAAGQDGSSKRPNFYSQHLHD